MTIWHTDTLTQFNLKMYEGLLKKEHITSNEVCKTFLKNKFFGYVLEKENPVTKLKDRFFVRTEHVESLPLRVSQSQKFSHSGEVYSMVINAVSRRIPTKKELSFKELVDFYANYSHSVESHWKLARIICIAGYFERLNIRIVSEASFGKDALVDILQIVNGGVSNLYNATLGKLKYSLHNDFIVINELGGLKQEEIGSLQVYLTQAGAYKAHYENNSRKVQGTKETMDLRNKSHIIFHNVASYYESKGQKYFEQMFTHAIMDRFPALLLKGYVSQDFSHAEPIDSFSEADIRQLKEFIATLNWFKNNHINKYKYKLNDDFWGFKGKQKQRSLRSFKIIAKYLSHYSETEKEFLELCKLLNSTRNDYLTSINQDNKLDLIEEDVV